ncbi:MAG: hypothetical protein KBB16_02950 [Candidatus Pacebacteria bacterium]|nr:hypothetical protein [Candidatus Paceibacterota bacterium]
MLVSKLLKKTPPLKEDRTALTFEQNGQLFHFASIKIDRDKNELIYVFYFKDKKGLVKFVDYEKNPPEEAMVRLPDHISFHRDGKVHLKYKDEKGRMGPVDEKRLPNTPFSVGKDQWALLLFHSLYEAQERALPIEVNEDHKHSREISIGSKTGRFTVVLFAVGESIDEVAMLNSHFPGIFEVHAILGNIWLPSASSKPYQSRLLVAISSKAMYPQQKGLFFTFGTIPPEKAIRGIVH